MSPETVVEFFFVTIETGVGTRQAVPLVRAVAQILGCKTKKRRSISCSVAHPLVKRKKKVDGVSGQFVFEAASGSQKG